MSFYILRKCEYFFGGFILDVIKQEKPQNLCDMIFYKEKLDLMVRTLRSVANFKKIYQNPNKKIVYDNIIDRQMKKIVDEFKIMKKKKEKKKKKNDNQEQPNNNQEFIYNRN